VREQPSKNGEDVLSDAVAVVIPAYNAASYIEETLRSVLVQTTPVAEIILVDDGSTDGTATIASTVDPRIRIIQQQREGVARARNVGARASASRWLAFLDSDDVWRADKIERQLETAGTDGEFVYSDRENIGARGALPVIQSSIQTMVSGDVFVDLLVANVISTSSVLLTRSLFDRVGAFDEDARLQPAEDWDLWLRCAAACEIRVVKEPLLFYRLHPDSASRNVDRMNAARMLVVEAALATPRGESLSAAELRLVRSELCRTNAMDAARHGLRSLGLRWLLRALRIDPFRPSYYAEFLRVATGRARH
jgi:glycosyltransferase involved in cell wall biosynthesis